MWYSMICALGVDHTFQGRFDKSQHHINIISFCVLSDAVSYKLHFVLYDYYTMVFVGGVLWTIIIHEK